MNKLTIIVGLTTLSMAAVADITDLPSTIPSAPGMQEPMKECRIGETYSLQSYKNDFNCVYLNIAVLSGSSDWNTKTPLWLLKAVDAINDIALAASTIPGQLHPESLSRRAVQVALTHVATGEADSVKDRLCAQARVAIENACISYYCGPAKPNVVSAELAEAENRIHTLCPGVQFNNCMPVSTANECTARNQRKTSLANAIQARLAAGQGKSVRGGTLEKIEQWVRSSQEQLRNLDENILEKNFNTKEANNALTDPRRFELEATIPLQKEKIAAQQTYHEQQIEELSSRADRECTTVAKHQPCDARQQLELTTRRTKRINDVLRQWETLLNTPPAPNDSSVKIETYLKELDEFQEKAESEISPPLETTPKSSPVEKPRFVPVRPGLHDLGSDQGSIDPILSLPRSAKVEARETLER